MKYRYVFLDYTRIIAAYLVVLGHLLPISGNVVKGFIYSFHISLFFLVSGMLHSYKENIQIKKYTKTILVPAVFFYFFIGILLNIFDYYSIFDMNNNVSCGIENTNLIQFLCLSTWRDLEFLFCGKYGTNGPCWFLFALFILKIMTDISLQNKRNLIVCLLLCPILFAFAKFVINPLSIGRAMLAFPFYIFGYYYKESIIKLSNNNYSRVLTIAFLIVLLGCLYINHQPSYTSLEFGILPFPGDVVFFYLSGISGTFMIMLFCSKWRKCKYVELFANSLITILGVQALFFKPFISIYGRNMNLVIYIIIAAIITMLCCLVHYILSKNMPFVIGKK